MKEELLHEAFADWFRPVRVTVSKDLLEARYSAALAAGTATRKQGTNALSLVPAMFAGGDFAVPTWLVSAMKKADPTLLLNDNDHELRVIVASGLALAMEDRKHDCSAMANAVRCASLMGARRPTVEIPLVRIAGETLAHWSGQKRLWTPWDPAQAPKLDRKKLEETLGTVIAGTSWQAPADAMRYLADAVDSALGAAAVSANGALRHLDARMASLREESGLVWWAAGGWTRATNRPICEMNGSDVPLIVGMEVSRHVAIQPAPTSVLAVIGRALLRGDGSRRPGVVLSRAVDEMSPDNRASWLSSVSNERFSSVAPLTDAIARASRDGERWRDGYERATGIDPDLSIEPELLALQACEEQLLPAQFT